MFKIKKRLKPVNIAHRLNNYDGLCKNLHGHCYSIVIELSSETEENGLSIDFNVFKKFNDFVQEAWDHATLVNRLDDPLRHFLDNEGMKYWLIDGNTTCENMAKELVKLGKPFFKNKKMNVYISETENNELEYYEI
jgi:6-pyruvoyltetrahydropterin/6-carboxytetrahydropterin synthase